MIPKVIHYCWFGKGEMPKLAKKCIESWEKHCPEYQIIQWNEENFDITSNQYVYEAYQSKKFAFVTDYVRLYVMYHYGGIYMDTDVEVVSSLDKFLNHQAFSGFETPVFIPTGIMACEKGFNLFGDFLAFYNNKRFIKEDGSLDLTSNVRTMTSILDNKGLVKNGQFQVVNGFALYPVEYFCPLDNATGRLTRTENTATIHWFNKSWIDAKKRNRSKITRVFHRVFGVNCFNWLKKVVG
jgi:hypothetical protein